jgi:hypothetical protein
VAIPRVKKDSPIPGETAGKKTQEKSPEHP